MIFFCVVTKRNEMMMSLDWQAYADQSPVNFRLVLLLHPYSVVNRAEIPVFPTVVKYNSCIHSYVAVIFL